MKDLMPMGARMPMQGEGIQLLRLGQECVLWDVDGHQRCALNETAAALWELCDGDTTVDEMVEAVCVVSSVDRHDLVADIERALGEMATAGLIEWQP